MRTNDVLLVKYNSEGVAELEITEGGDRSEWPDAIAIDTANNIYIVGRTEEGQGSYYSTDIFISKYDNSGNFLRHTLSGTSSRDYAEGIAVDQQGNVFITGFTEGTYDGTTPDAYWDSIIEKYDADGNIVWREILSHSGTESIMAKDITIDANGNVFITGYCTYSLGGNTNAGIWDLFISKYNNDLVPEFCTQMTV